MYVDDLVHACMLLVCLFVFFLENHLFIVKKISFLQPLCLLLNSDWIISLFSFFVRQPNSSNFLCIRIRSNNIRPKHYHGKTNANLSNIESKFALICKIIINHIRILVIAYFFVRVSSCWSQIRCQFQLKNETLTDGRTKTKNKNTLASILNTNTDSALTIQLYTNPKKKNFFCKE